MKYYLYNRDCDGMIITEGDKETIEDEIQWQIIDNGQNPDDLIILVEPTVDVKVSVQLIENEEVKTK
jgi:hypothetical protein